jgi:hypothetical protein
MTSAATKANWEREDAEREFVFKVSALALYKGSFNDPDHPAQAPLAKLNDLIREAREINELGAEED